MTQPDSSSSVDDPQKITLPKSITEAEDAPDSRTADWQENQAKELGSLDLDLKALDLKLRKLYAALLFGLLLLWLAGVYTLLVLVALQKLVLSDAVLIAALGTTTANVIGLFIVVARYIFPRRDHHPRPSDGTPN